MDNEIFRLIERHAALTLKIKHMCASEDGDASEAAIKAMREQDETAWMLIEHPPTTLAGLQALLEYVVELEASHVEPWPEIDPRGAGRDFLVELHRVFLACLKNEARSRRAAA